MENIYHGSFFPDGMLSAKQKVFFNNWLQKTSPLQKCVWLGDFSGPSQTYTTYLGPTSNANFLTKKEDCCKKKKIYTSEISLKSKGINSRYLPERHRLYVPLVSTITMCDMLPKHKVSENGTASNLQKEVLKVVERCPYLGLVTVMSISFTLNVWELRSFTVSIFFSWRTFEVELGQLQ